MTVQVEAYLKRGYKLRRKFSSRCNMVMFVLL